MTGGRRTRCERAGSRLGSLNGAKTEAFALAVDARGLSFVVVRGPAHVRRQAEAWLVVLKKAGDGAPYSPARLAWLAELTEGLAGHVTPALQQRRAVHALAVTDVERLRARLASRVVTRSDVLRSPSLRRRPVRWWSCSISGALMRVLADELQLDDGLRAEVQLALAALQQPEPKSPSLTALTGRVLRELQAVQAAFSAAGVKAPTLKLKR